MYKLLVNHAGSQEIFLIEKSGGYIDQSKVLWDERFDGQFPDNLLSSVGGLDRVGNSLVVDPVKLQAQTDKKNQDATKALNNKNKRISAQLLLKNFDDTKDPSNQEIKDLLKALISLVKGE